MLTLLVWLLGIALLVVAVRRFVPETSQPMKMIMVWVLVAIAVLLILQAFGVLNVLNAPLPRG